MQDNISVALVNVTKRFGEVVAVDRVSLEIREGEFFSLLGPSGCGKTTTLRLIAGFEIPTSGEIMIGGKSQGILPAYRRPVNTVFQHYALFPHMNVAQNISFGLEMKGVEKRTIWRRVQEALELVHLVGMEKRKPGQLSGGQQQRVALARALINRPKVLLLDEPLGALDLKLRKAMQDELKLLQEQVGITFVYVTHDQEEALTMSDRIAVMQDGQVLQVGAPFEIYEYPTNRYVADFIGETNFLPGRIERVERSLAIRITNGMTVLARQAQEGIRVGENAVLSIRPEKVHLYPTGYAPAVDCSEIACARGHVEQAVYLGTDTRYVIDLEGGVRLVARQQNMNGSEHRIQAGDGVDVQWNTNHAIVLRE